MSTKNEGFSYGQTVVGISDNKVYKIAIIRTKQGGCVIQDIVTKQHKEVATSMIRPFIERPTPMLAKNDEIFVEERKIGTTYVIKAVYPRTERVEVRLKDTYGSSFFIHERLVKKIEKLL